MAMSTESLLAVCISFDVEDHECLLGYHKSLLGL